MYQVDEHRPPTRADAAPVGVVVRIMLAHGPQALDRGEPADSPAPDCVPCNCDRRVETAVVAHGERHSMLRHRTEQYTSRRERVGDRLFHQHRQSAFGAGDADFGMTVVRSCDDRTVERLAGEQLPEVPVEACAVTLGRASRRFQRVRHCDDRALGLLIGELQMSLTDPPAPNNANRTGSRMGILRSCRQARPLRPLPNGGRPTRCADYSMLLRRLSNPTLLDVRDRARTRSPSAPGTAQASTLGCLHRGCTSDLWRPPRFATLGAIDIVFVD